MNWNFLLKRYNYTWLQNFVPLRMLFAKTSIIRNWFLALQPNAFKIICNLPKWVQERA